MYFLVLQSIVLEQQIEEQDTTITQLRQQLKDARATLENTTMSLNKQIETLEVSMESRALNRLE